MFRITWILFFIFNPHTTSTYWKMWVLFSQKQNHADIKNLKSKIYLLSEYLSVISGVHKKMSIFLTIFSFNLFGRMRFLVLVYLDDRILFIPAANEVWGWGCYIGYIWLYCPSVCLSVCLSVCPPSVDMILSTDVLRDGCLNFFEICTLITDHLQMCTWNFNICIFFNMYWLESNRVDCLCICISSHYLLFVSITWYDPTNIYILIRIITSFVLLV